MPCSEAPDYNCKSFFPVVSVTESLRVRAHRPERRGEQIYNLVRKRTLESYSIFFFFGYHLLSEVGNDLAYSFLRDCCSEQGSGPE
ncbi:hypothetical protein JYU34_002842 [Plutella xylostella]|uniref:Uncharacterized protein n=1 Tax=Plutella xylostella TaxID=51655 RepID=A0ABQ7R3A0_PLUXY|nr:hypothetical protein JYU34_002842 [Plutella xylostella]